jgi:hypothetical protein
MALLYLLCLLVGVLYLPLTSAQYMFGAKGCVDWQGRSSEVLTVRLCRSKYVESVRWS